jgi:transcriptional antiterminator NusG
MYRRGERVRIKSGAFASFTGEVEEVCEETGTLKVVVSIFARTTPVEMPLAEAEKLDAPQRPWTNSTNN